MRRELKKLVTLDRNIAELPRLSPLEERLLESEHRFEATYHSNKLEGNKLTKDEARKAISFKLK